MLCGAGLLNAVLSRQVIDKSPDGVQVQPMHGDKLGTKSPGDVFVVVMEFIGLINKLASPALHVRMWPRQCCIS